MEWGASGKKKHLLMAHNFCMEEVNDLVDKAFGGTGVVNSIVGNNSESVSATSKIENDTGLLIKKNIDADGAGVKPHNNKHSEEDLGTKSDIDFQGSENNSKIHGSSHEGNGPGAEDLEMQNQKEVHHVVKIGGRDTTGCFTITVKSNFRYALKKKPDIIWEFFPNVGRLYCKRPEGEASQEEKLCSWTGSPAPSSQWLPESTENQATCRATWSAQKALLVFYEIN